MRRLFDRGAPPPDLEAAAAASVKILKGKVARGKSTFNFSSSIYGSVDVRLRLKIAQSGTCAYCEAVVEPVTKGDIEHFRPKGGYRNIGDGSDNYPGYYWLAYEWSNLLIACPRCNQDSKRTFFPISVGGVRALSPDDDLAAEGAILIDPFNENPRDHIRFNQEVPVSWNGSERGRLTIEILGLDCEQLNEARRKRRDIVLGMKKLANGASDAEDANFAIGWLSEHAGPNCEYSSFLSDVDWQE